jgi:hypothetical protein
MAIRHRCWRFRIPEAVDTLRSISSLDDLLKPSVTEEVERIRTDPRRADHLVLARLDPSDDEEWGVVLAPSAFDYGREQAGAARLVLVLVNLCVPVGGIQSSSFLVEEILKTAGWDDGRRDVVVRGARLVTFFENHTPWLAPVARECRDWLQGGWLDQPTAAKLKENLDRDMAVFEANAEQVAAKWAEGMFRSPSELETMIHSGLTDTRAMLMHAEPGSALWIIED